MRTILIIILFNSLTIYTLTARAADKVICTESDGTKLTASEVEDAVNAWMEDQDGEVEPTDYSTEYDLLVDELCID